MLIEFVLGSTPLVSLLVANETKMAPTKTKMAAAKTKMQNFNFTSL